MEARVATSAHRDDRPEAPAGTGAATDSPRVDEASPKAPSSRVFRRLVLFFPGHDPTDMDYHHGRFANQAERFGKLWSVEVSVTPRLDDGEQHYARWEASARGPNWSTRTEYRILRWEDIIGALDARPDPVRLWRGFGGLWDFLRGGAARGYFRASPRYGAFFFFPYLICALFIAGAVLAGAVALWTLGSVLPAPFAWLAALAAGSATFFALFHRPGRDWRLHQALDDWDLARDYLRDRTPALDARLDRFADVLCEVVRAGGHDEIILVGHSLGATLMLGVIERALDLDPGLADGPMRVNLLTCGATIPKLALHAKGGKVRRQAARVAATPRLTWVEYQARHDAINFYKFHPVTLRRAGFDHPEPSPPVLRNANIKEMLTHAKLKRLRWHAMRLHYQFLLANEQKAPYDYFMFALGPLSFPDLSSRAEGPVGRFAADGSLIA
ncbi:hypothetical protein EV667_0564 [Ancylobacter aquaticus]|uniref:Alpha/beta hydrolase n=1 Tax=Ancylobacter aquaticus TaxID=100 RepID=A0A4R1I556_ANCAQ|nr:hypothetical protein [Ancylobacter aquaticus]TCK30474.1 hypothetical protein EV667_0564 [Ancylobacter aquaticus]